MRRQNGPAGPASRSLKCGSGSPQWGRASRTTRKARGSLRMWRRCPLFGGADWSTGCWKLCWRLAGRGATTWPRFRSSSATRRRKWLTRRPASSPTKRSDPPTSRRSSARPECCGSCGLSESFPAPPPENVPSVQSFSSEAGGLTVLPPMRLVARASGVYNSTTPANKKIFPRGRPPNVSMPRRTDIRKILIIGSGPIVIGQACEFDYSGTQACKALRAEGYEVVLVNSNPATIMTDPETADRTYVEPLTVESVSEIIRRERPDALLPTVGGQTALNLAMALDDAGVLAECGVEMIGAKREAIRVAEDREMFKRAMEEEGLPMPRGGFAHSWAEAEKIVEETGYPAIIRPSFTLGGTGGGTAYSPEEFEEIVRGGLAASPVTQVLIEESILGWKEFELEVMRDLADNVVIICSIENFDPMGVHTGDSITVAPAQTLTDVEYQRLRDMAIRVIRKVGVETGGSNIQFAVSPEDGEVRVIEMNPRVSRSSALASKATGFPIAKIAAKLAVGYTLDEISNDITRETPASFEPTIDYVVTKIPKWNFEKFRDTEDVLGTQMKSVGEVMAIGRTDR